MAQETQRLRGSVAIITGAGRGIGRAIALRFGAEGAQVVVNDIDLAVAQEAAQAIVAAGGEAMAVAADVSRKDQVDLLFDAAEARFGPPDILVNNAAIASPAAAGRHFLEGDEEWWDRIITINLKSVYLCSHRAAQSMARRGKGVIINMSSGGATRAHRGMASYDASKGGIEALTRAMALDLGPYGVRVNGLVPGSIDTIGMSEEIRRQRGETMPLNRVGDPEDLGGPAVFLASADAAYVTGHMLVVDGGFLAQQRSAQVDIYPPSQFPKL